MMRSASRLPSATIFGSCSRRLVSVSSYSFHFSERGCFGTTAPVCVPSCCRGPGIVWRPRWPASRMCTMMHIYKQIGSAFLLCREDAPLPQP